MAFRIKLTVNQVIDGCSAVVIGINNRKANAKYHYEDDVAKYPKIVRLAITNDPAGINDGQVIVIKVKNAGNLKIGQAFTFNSKDGATVPNGTVHFWTRNGFVEIAMKGDEIIDRH